MEALSTIEKPKLDNSRKSKGIYLIDPEFEETRKKNAWQKLEFPMEAEIPCEKEKKGDHPRSTKRTKNSPFSYADGHLISQECGV